MFRSRPRNPTNRVGSGGGVDSLPLIVNLLGVGRGGRPPGEPPAAV